MRTFLLIWCGLIALLCLVCPARRSHWRVVREWVDAGQWEEAKPANKKATTKLPKERVEQTISSAVANLFDARDQESCWDLSPFLGTWLLSKHYALLTALGQRASSGFDAQSFANRLLRTQLDDGSWELVHDCNAKGSLDATIWNYLFLKMHAEASPEDVAAALKRAMAFILEHGGLESANMLTKWFLATFGIYPWRRIWYVPLFLFCKGSFYMRDLTAQWVYPHLVPMAYLRCVEAVFPLGCGLDELWVAPPKASEYRPSATNRSGLRLQLQRLSPMFSDVLSVLSVFRCLPSAKALEPLLTDMLELWRPKGTFGTYTTSTSLMLLVVKSFSSHRRLPELEAKITAASASGLDAIERLYFRSNVLSAYEGTTMDGRWWDTTLASLALAEAGERQEKIAPTVDTLLRRAVDADGAMGYGYDFEYCPDLDDTSMLATLLAHCGRDDASKASLHWALARQNRDGGFPAFDANKNPSGLYGLLLGTIGTVSCIDNAAELFDPSCADITGHVLEAMGVQGMDYEHPAAASAIRYLKRTQHSCGSWEGRWGINYLYGAGAVLPALEKIGYPLANQRWIGRVVRFLQCAQNADGGFGESADSYLDPKLAGVGASTVTQTAWGLLALLAVRESYDVLPCIERAMSYLLTEFERAGNRFMDSSTVGTGHRGMIYLQYPAYAMSFPVIALARARRLLYC